MKFTLYLLSFFVYLYGSECAMTEEQVKNAGKVIRSACQPKHKVTNEQITAVHKGKYDDVEPNMKCYMECTLKMLKLLKNGKMDYDSCVGRIDMVPDSLREVTLISANACKDSVKSSDKCEQGFELYKCVYDYTGKLFYLP